MWIFTGRDHLWWDSHQSNCTRKEILLAARNHLIVDSSYERRESLLNTRMVRVKLRGERRREGKHVCLERQRTSGETQSNGSSRSTDAERLRRDLDHRAARPSVDRTAVTNVRAAPLFFPHRLRLESPWKSSLTIRWRCAIAGCPFSNDFISSGFL